MLPIVLSESIFIAWHIWAPVLGGTQEYSEQDKQTRKIFTGNKITDLQQMCLGLILTKRDSDQDHVPEVDIKLAEEM